MLSIEIDNKEHLEKIALNQDPQFTVMKEIIIGYHYSMLIIKTIVKDNNDDKFYMLWWERDLSGKGNHILENKLYEVERTTRVVSEVAYLPVVDNKNS